jgi:hypothetical protein
MDKVVFTTNIVLQSEQVEGTVGIIREVNQLSRRDFNTILIYFRQASSPVAAATGNKVSEM